MSKTGTELQDAQLGDLKSLVALTEYEPRVTGVRVSMVYDYTVPDPIEPDDGKRQKGVAVYLTEADFKTLEKAQQDAVVALAESK